MWICQSFCFYPACNFECNMSSFFYVHGKKIFHLFFLNVKKPKCASGYLHTKTYHNWGQCRNGYTSSGSKPCNFSHFTYSYFGNIFKMGILNFLVYIVICPGKYFAPAEVRHERLSKYLWFEPSKELLLNVSDVTVFLRCMWPWKKHILI